MSRDLQDTNYILVNGKLQRLRSGVYAGYEGKIALNGHKEESTMAA